MLSLSDIQIVVWLSLLVLICVLLFVLNRRPGPQGPQGFTGAEGRDCTCDRCCKDRNHWSEES